MDISSFAAEEGEGEGGRKGKRNERSGWKEGAFHKNSWREGPPLIA